MAATCAVDKGHAAQHAAAFFLLLATMQTHFTQLELGSSPAFPVCQSQV
jgi:hypothetical protein